MPDLFQDNAPSQRTEQVPQPERAQDVRPGAADGLSPNVVQALEEARQGGLQRLYGTDWEAAGARLDEAYRAEGPSAYERLEQRPESYGAVTGESRYSEMVAGGLYARERVLAEARGETSNDTYRSGGVAQSGALQVEVTQELGLRPPVAIRPGQQLPFREVNPHVLMTGSAPIPIVPIATPVQGNIVVRSTNTVNGREYASVDINAECGISTSDVGTVNTMFTGGKLVELDGRGRPTGNEIPFRLEDRTEGRDVHPEYGSNASLGVARSIQVPTGRAYRVEINTTTDLPERNGVGDRLRPDVTMSRSFVINNGSSR